MRHYSLHINLLKLDPSSLDERTRYFVKQLMFNNNKFNSKCALVGVYFKPQKSSSRFSVFMLEYYDTIRKKHIKHNVVMSLPIVVGIVEVTGEYGVPYLLLVEKFRTPLAQVNLECPSGPVRLFPNCIVENDLDAIHRKFREDTGFDINNISMLERNFATLSPSLTNESVSIGYAKADINESEMIFSSASFKDNGIYHFKIEQLDPKSNIPFTKSCWLFDKYNFVLPHVKEYCTYGEAFWNEMHLSGHTLYALKTLFLMEKVPGVINGEAWESITIT